MQVVDVDALLLELVGLADVVSKARQRRAEILHCLPPGRHLGTLEDIVVSEQSWTDAYSAELLKLYVPKHTLAMCTKRKKVNKRLKIAKKLRERVKKS